MRPNKTGRRGGGGRLNLGLIKNEFHFKGNNNIITSEEEQRKKKPTSLNDGQPTSELKLAKTNGVRCWLTITIASHLSQVKSTNTEIQIDKFI